MLALVAEKLEQFPAMGKVIVYSSSVDGADSLGEVLGCEVYHRTADTQDGKARRLMDWMEGRGGVRKRPSNCCNKYIGARD